MNNPELHGYYWVSLNHVSWEPAHWDGKTWEFMGSDIDYITEVAHIGPMIPEYRGEL